MLHIRTLGWGKKKPRRFVLSQLWAATAFAASPRKLRDDYNGPAMRVRRNSDNAELDIGFLANGDLNVYALMNHVGAENLLLWSEDFSNAIWTRSANGASLPVVTPNNAMSPDGTMSADTVAFSAGGQWSFIYQSNSALANGAAHRNTVRMRGKIGGESVYLMWTPDGSTYARTQCVLTTEWQTFLLPFNAATGANYIQIGVDQRDAGQTAKPAQTIEIWGAQLNTGPVALDYCRTTSAPTVSGSGFVTCMYDQSGNARDQSQATAANQPRIVGTGLIDRKNLRPVLQVDATDSLTVASTVIQSTAIVAQNDAISQLAQYVLSGASQGIYWGGTGAATGIGAINGNTVQSTIEDTTTLHQASIVCDSGNCSLWVDGAFIGSAAISNFTITAILSGFVGKLAEVICFAGALSTGDRLALESNQKTYYGTP